MQASVAVLERDLREGEEASRQLIALRRDQESALLALEDESFSSELRAQIAEVNRRLGALAYDAEAHQQASAEISSLKGADLAWLKLEEAQNRIVETRDDLRSAIARGTELGARIEGDQVRLREVEVQASELPRLEERLRESVSALERVGGNLRERQDRLAGLRERLQNVRALEDRSRSQRIRLNKATREKGSYEELARAFGKGGVQALIIETVLPEIEDEANRLLSRMTDNRMHVKIETQREKRSGGSIETLDINIADELGSRPYEMFSGGEAFRINFALRVAISRLLTRRAGAPLRILFIDEGFGTQDGSGREKLLDTIYSIQEDFDRIIVITHIDELKEAFPVRILVTKTEQGSVFSIN